MTRSHRELDELASDLRDASEAVYEVNAANGWFDDERTVGDDIALLHSEVSEMLEAYRETGLADATGITAADITGVYHPGDRVAKPEGFGSECADVLIRLLDTCQRRGVNLAFEFERKLEHNKSRGYRHGGKAL